MKVFVAPNAMRADETRRRVADALARVGLDQWPDMRVEEYSRGMKQRLHIARGLLADPEVIDSELKTLGLLCTGFHWVSNQVRSGLPIKSHARARWIA